MFLTQFDHNRAHWIVQPELVKYVIIFVCSFKECLQ
jgi:hypothetical protein